MPLESYGVLKGNAVDRRTASGANPHYQVKLVDLADEWRIAINVQSADGSAVEYGLISDFAHPIIDDLQQLSLGFHPLPASTRRGLDYIRGNLADPRSFVPLPAQSPGPDNDLNEKVDHYIQRAMADSSACLYAFGATWGPEKIRDKVFGFQPGRGIHDIHMNQGNTGQWLRDNGPWQDGGLIFEFPSAKQWVAILLKFETQPWHTDDATGNPLPPSGGGPPSDAMPPGRLDRISLPIADRPDGLVRIVAAMINSASSPEDETVTLLNTSAAGIDLGGWKLIDTQGNAFLLEGMLPPGQSRLFHVRPGLQLSNRGGLISLLEKNGLRVDGVSYTKEQARNPGWTIVF